MNGNDSGALTGVSSQTPSSSSKAADKEKKHLGLPDASSDIVTAQTQNAPTEKSLPDEDGEVWQDLGEELYRMSRGDDLGPLGERL